MENEGRSLTVRSIRTIFWLLLAFAVSVLMISVGATWAFLQWTGFLETGQLWGAFLVLVLGALGTIGCLAGIIAWFLRRASG
jgi:hypothetical protein